MYLYLLRVLWNCIHTRKCRKILLKIIRVSLLLLLLLLNEWVIRIFFVQSYRIWPHIECNFNREAFPLLPFYLTKSLLNVSHIFLFLFLFAVLSITFVTSFSAKHNMHTQRVGGMKEELQKRQALSAQMCANVCDVRVWDGRVSLQ